MVTPEVLRFNAAKLDALAEAFEQAYLHFLDIGEDEPEQRNRGSLAWYAIRDLLEVFIADADSMSKNMEMCNVILAARASRKKNENDLT